MSVAQALWRTGIWRFACLLAIAGCGRLPSREVPAQEPAQPEMSQGRASFYGGEDSLSGKRTASGEKYDPDELTAAHPSLPLGTRVRVTHTKNRRQVTVRINDRGPFNKGRIIDLSLGAAKALDMQQSGVAPVSIQELK